MSRAQGVHGFGAMSTEGGYLNLSDPNWKFGTGPGHRKPKISWASVAERLRNGESLQALAEEFERTPSTMLTRLNQQGWDSRGLSQTEAAAAAVHRGKRLVLPPAPDFVEDGVCSTVDPSLFYPEKGQAADRGKTAQAKKVCGGCPVRQQCLRWALDNNEHYGIWGGLTPSERQTLRRQAS